MKNQMIEDNFDVPFIAAQALREKQIQQNYRPIIAVHKWFARRPGTLFRGLLLAEFGQKPVQDLFYQSNDFSRKKIADPFMGGGTPLLEANRMGFDVQGFDINPMSAWIVKEEIEHINLEQYKNKANQLLQFLTEEIGSLYKTDCVIYGDEDVPVKYFLWVKTLDCDGCANTFDLFPGYLIAENKRHTSNIVICSCCGDLNDVVELKNLGDCKSCSAKLKLEGSAKRNKATCPHCGIINTYPCSSKGPLQHRLFAIEYFNPLRKANHKGRFFKKPDEKDLKKIASASEQLNKLNQQFIPKQEILAGDETNRLHRWGYKYYRELFNDRQLLGLELSCQKISSIKPERIRNALATNLSDLLRYQNMLCRYDTMALKSLDIFSVHGFPVGLVHCESNLIGIMGANTSVGSGGWGNIIEKYYKAKQYCDAPFEVQQQGNRKVQIPITGEWIGEQNGSLPSRKVSIQCKSSTEAGLKPESLDAVFTDPPYFGNVQYAELMDFCYVWLKNLIGSKNGFVNDSSRSKNELTGNATQEKGLPHFTSGISKVFQNMAIALKATAPLAFTYHHNKSEAYFAIGVAILDAGLVCTAALPCPAEMGGSIHISGTGSSIVDTIFVCRKASTLWAINENKLNIEDAVKKDLQYLEEGGRIASSGDIRCITFGHITKSVIQDLFKNWDKNLDVNEKIQLFSEKFKINSDISTKNSDIKNNMILNSEIKAKKTA